MFENLFIQNLFVQNQSTTLPEEIALSPTEVSSFIFYVQLKKIVDIINHSGKVMKKAIKWIGQNIVVIIMTSQNYIRKYLIDTVCNFK